MLPRLPLGQRQLTLLGWLRHLANQRATPVEQRYYRVTLHGFILSALLSQLHPLLLSPEHQHQSAEKQPQFLIEETWGIIEPSE